MPNHGYCHNQNRISHIIHVDLLYFYRCLLTLCVLNCFQEKLTKTSQWARVLTHWGRVTHICVSKLTIIGSYNGLSPDRRQAIIWTNAGLLLIGPLGTNFSEILIEIQHFHSRKCIWKCRLQNGGHFVSAPMCYWPSPPGIIRTPNRKNGRDVMRLLLSAEYHLV